MDYFIRIIESNINSELVFEVMKDLRIGGLNPSNYNNFIDKIRKLPEILKKSDKSSSQIDDFFAVMYPDFAYRKRLFLIKQILSEFNLKEVSDNESNRIWKKIVSIIYKKTQFCWHPDANASNCTTDEKGKVKISRAHSIQRSRILKRISENHKVKQIRLTKSEDSFAFPIKSASTFYGFCDKHDKTFDPIERQDYIGSSEQNFLFAYRAFVHSSHIKLVFYELYDYGKQPLNDLKNEKKIFDKSIRTMDFNRIKTDTIIFDYDYPLAVVSSSDLDFDFNGTKIPHSEIRMEQFYLIIFPQNKKTYVLFSYFKEDSRLYGNIVNQIINRNKIESDLSVLISGHCENVYFKPSYYDKNIYKQENNIEKLIKQTQFDFVPIDGYGNKTEPISMTPNDYLKNEFDIQLFAK